MFELDPLVGVASHSASNGAKADRRVGDGPHPGIHQSDACRNRRRRDLCRFRCGQFRNFPGKISL